MQTWILQDLVKWLEWVEALAYIAQHHLVVPCKKILGTSRGCSSSRDRSDPEGIRAVLLTTPVLQWGATPGLIWAEKNIISIIRALQQLLGSAATSPAFLWMGGWGAMVWSMRLSNILDVFFRQGVNIGHSPSVCRWVCCCFAWPRPVLFISANPLVPLGCCSHFC